MNNLIGTIALLSLSIPGYLVNLLILGKKRNGEVVALSWLTGSVIFTLTLFVFNYFMNIKLNLLSSGLVFLGLIFVALPFAYKKISIDKSIFKPSFFWILIPVFITSLFFPVVDWDAVTLFDFRGRILLDNGLIKDTLMMVPYTGYPMYTSLLHFWTYLTGLWTAMPIYPLFSLSLAMGVYLAAKRLFSQTVSICVALASLFAPKIFESSFIAYTNLPYTVFLVLGAIYIYLWVRERNWRDLIIGVILSVASFWVRSFPFAIVNFALILLAFPFFRKYSKVLAGLSAVALIGCYFIPTIYPVADYIKWAVYGYYTPYWIIFMALFIYNFVTNNKDWFWALLYVGYGLMLIIGTYHFYNINPGYYLGIPDAIRRMTMFVNPIVIFYAATSLARKK